VHITAADAAGLDANPDIARSKFWRRDIAQVEYAIFF
jgi:hypothetical protein